MEITNPNSNHSSTPPTAFGATLARARQKKQVSLEQAACELYILQRHLEALEQEDFSELPQETFARGFAINYAKYLDLDPVAVAASFDNVYPDELRSRKATDIESPLRPMGTLQRDGRSKIRFNPLLLLAIIGLIILGVFLLRMVTNASSESVEPEPEVEVITPSEQAQGAAVTGAGVAIGLQDNNNTTATLTPTQLSNTASATLDIWVKADTDISVIDAAGNRLMTGVQSRGGYNLTGKPPFRIDIKNVSNVSMNLNKQPIGLAQYATDNQANFVLTP